MQEEEIKGAYVTCAFVLKTTFPHFNHIVEVLQQDPKVRIVFVKSSLRKLFIKEEEGENKNELTYT